MDDISSDILKQLGDKVIKGKVLAILGMPRLKHTLQSALPKKSGKLCTKQTSKDLHKRPTNLQKVTKTTNELLAAWSNS